MTREQTIARLAKLLAGLAEKSKTREQAILALRRLVQDLESAVPPPGSAPAGRKGTGAGNAPSRGQTAITEAARGRDEVDELCRYWKRRCDHPKALVTADRRRAVAARLRDGYTPAQIRRAIDGAADSAWHQGENEAKRRYDDVTLICRSGSKLEAFIELGGEPVDEDRGAEERELRERARAALQRGDRVEYERINAAMRQEDER